MTHDLPIKTCRSENLIKCYQFRSISYNVILSEGTLYVAGTSASLLFTTFIRGGCPTVFVALREGALIWYTLQLFFIETEGTLMSIC